MKKRTERCVFKNSGFKESVQIVELVVLFFLVLVFVFFVLVVIGIIVDVPQVVVEIVGALLFFFVLEFLFLVLLELVERNFVFVVGRDRLVVLDVLLPIVVIVVEFVLCGGRLLLSALRADFLAGFKIIDLANGADSFFFLYIVIVFQKTDFACFAEFCFANLAQFFLGRNPVQFAARAFLILSHNNLALGFDFYIILIRCDYVNYIFVIFKIFFAQPYMVYIKNKFNHMW